MGGSISFSLPHEKRVRGSVVEAAAGSSYAKDDATTSCNGGNYSNWEASKVCRRYRRPVT